MADEKKDTKPVEGGAKRRRIEELLDRKRDPKLLRGVPEDPEEKAKRLRELAVASGISEARYKRLTTAEKERLMEKFREAMAEASGKSDVAEA